MTKEIKENIEELVQSSFQQDYNKANKVFGDIMSAKLGDLLDQEQIAVANSIFSNEEPEVDDEYLADEAMEEDDEEYGDEPIIDTETGEVEEKMDWGPGKADPNNPITQEAPGVADAYRKLRGEKAKKKSGPKGMTDAQRKTQQAGVKSKSGPKGMTDAQRKTQQSGVKSKGKDPNIASEIDAGGTKGGSGVGRQDGPGKPRMKKPKKITGMTDAQRRAG